MKLKKTVYDRKLERLVNRQRIRVKQIETNNKVYGGDIYIQSTRPEGAGVFVWIDTANIDVLQ